MSHSLIKVGTALVIALAAIVFFLPPPEGYTPQTMHAGALCVLVIGIWALGSLPEHIVALVFSCWRWCSSSRRRPSSFRGSRRERCGS